MIKVYGKILFLKNWINENLLKNVIIDMIMQINSPINIDKLLFVGNWNIKDFTETKNSKRYDLSIGWNAKFLSVASEDLK